jgi:hypothetical protein
MLDKPIQQITYDDVAKLVADQIPEGKTVDYKRDLYGGKDDDKRELLKDVSSFANTEGGDILIGVAENKGLPVSTPGIATANADQEIQRMDSIIRTGIEPRIECAIRVVATPDANAVFIIRVKESLLSPHRVVFQKFGEFWARNSAGKYSMDTTELRRAFTASEAVFERMRDFRRSRVEQILRDETPTPMRKGGKCILHLIPIMSFRTRFTIELSDLSQTSFPPLGAGGWNHRLNLDGLLWFDGSVEAENQPRKVFGRSYTQLFRNGSIEAVLGDVVQQKTDGLLFHPLVCERHLVVGLKQYLQALHNCGITPDVWGFVTITGVRDAWAVADAGTLNEHQVDRDILWLPEFVVTDMGSDPHRVLKDTFELVWNAAGLSRPRPRR